MIDPKVKADTIAHYERMIAWVKTQPPDASVFSYKMKSAIGETWRGEYCPICATYHNYFVDDGGCLSCPIAIRTGQEECLGSPWGDMDAAGNWKEWLINAQLELDFIKSLE